MDAKITEFIERQRRDIDRCYDLPPEERRKAEELLERMERLGDRCRRWKEFERVYLSRSMYQEYNCMLLEFGLYMKPEVIAEITEKYDESIRKQKENNQLK